LGVFRDGWQPDGCFHYTGEGQRGDQRMLSGNRSILDHEAEGRALRLFKGARGQVEYVGEFELDKKQPWYETDAPETGGGPLRKVIVFRLRPLDTAAPAEPQSKIADVIAAEVIQQVAIEEQHTEKSYVEPDRQPYEAERREASLVQALATHLRSQDHKVCRLQIVPEGEFKPLFTDLYDETAEVLVEAKGSVTRENIRMAIGQLADYARFVPTARKAILLPSRPRADLEELLRSASIDMIWAVDGSFEATDGNLI
jgi:hypothetical protein